MDGGDLKTLNRWHGGDLKTLSRQHGGIFGLLGKLFGLGLSDKQHGGIFGLLGKLFGLGPGELQKQMSDPIKQQMIIQRCGFPWALAGLSLLPALLGKGEEDRIRNQMQMTRDPIMQRGGLAIPPALISKGLPLLKQIGIPTAMGALASLGDNLVDEILVMVKQRAFGGVQRASDPRRDSDSRREHHVPNTRERNRCSTSWVTSWQHRQEIRSRSFSRRKKPGEWLRKLATRSAGNSLHRKRSDWNPSPRTPLLQNNSEKA